MLGLGQAYLVFWAVLAVQLVVVLLTKQWFSQQFRQAGLGSKLLHGLHCLNIPDIHTDWDEDRAETRNEVISSRNIRMRETASWFLQNGPLAPLDMLRKRRREVVREMAATQLVNCVFNLLLLTPIIVTGKGSLDFELEYFVFHLLNILKKKKSLNDFQRKLFQD